MGFRIKLLNCIDDRVRDEVLSESLIKNLPIYSVKC